MASRPITGGTYRQKIERQSAKISFQLRCVAIKVDSSRNGNAPYNFYWPIKVQEKTLRNTVNVWIDHFCMTWSETIKSDKTRFHWACIFDLNNRVGPEEWTWQAIKWLRLIIFLIYSSEFHPKCLCVCVSSIIHKSNPCAQKMSKIAWLVSNSGQVTVRLFDGSRAEEGETEPSVRKVCYSTNVSCLLEKGHCSVGYEFVMFDINLYFCMAFERDNLFFVFLLYTMNLFLCTLHTVWLMDRKPSADWTSQLPKHLLAPRVVSAWKKCHHSFWHFPHSFSYLWSIFVSFIKWPMEIHTLTSILLLEMNSRLNRHKKL